MDEYLTKEEIDAYRFLDGVPFDFGNGEICPTSTSSEDAYLEIMLDNLEECTEELARKHSKYISRKEKRHNRIISKSKKNKKIKDSINYNYFVVNKEFYGEEYYTKLYLSKKRKFCKKQTNKLIRKSNDNFGKRGSSYKRKFNYWNVIF